MWSSRRIESRSASRHVVRKPVEEHRPEQGPVTCESKWTGMPYIMVPMSIWRLSTVYLAMPLGTVYVRNLRAQPDYRSNIIFLSVRVPTCDEGAPRNHWSLAPNPPRYMATSTHQVLCLIMHSIVYLDQSRPSSRRISSPAASTPLLMSMYATPLRSDGRSSGDLYSKRTFPLRRPK